MNKPLTLRREEYMTTLVSAINNSGLPAFVLIDVLEQAVRELRPLAAAELKRDEEAWKARQTEAPEKQEVGQ